ncbi:MAG: UDP-N-acetyl-D-glucosamine dehydrogenase [Bacteroidota bacterium]|nr:UDP-N-acetyl-D-glucosamine dehydrogenase [Bacteroidota bacterium]
MSENEMTSVSGYLDKIRSGNICVGVVGLGYVGLPIAIEYALKDILTIGIDVDQNKIEKLNRCENYIADINTDWISKTIRNGKLNAGSDFAECGKCDAIYICVPTPFTPNKEPDISFIINAAEEISKYLKKGQIIILKSTTFPGTTEKYVLPVLERSGLKAGVDFFLAFSPERIDPGNKVWTTANTPIVVGGIDEQSTELAAAVHNLIVDKIKKVSSPSIAEMEKLLENIFRSVNIALVNELAQLCDRVGINIWEVIDAASTKPFGFMPFYPGPGIGGHCILIDPYYLAWMAREYDFVTKFITFAAEINEDMPFYVRSMIIREIARQPITMKDAKVLLLGMAFKRDVDDLRHSPALKVAELLCEDGIENVSYFDPYIPQINVKGRLLDSEKAITAELLESFDIIAITTDHSTFDLELIGKHSKVIIDTRNAMKNITGNRNNIVLLGDGK